MVNMIRGDLDFILAQIKIAEADAQGVNLLTSGLIPNPELPWGLRRVDGSNNNLTPGQGSFGAADQPFPDGLNGGTPLNQGDDGMRFGPPVLDLLGNPVLGFEGGLIPGTSIVVPPGYAVGINFLANNEYGVHTPNNPLIIDPRAIQPGDVVDADPRLISNLVVDQTLNNPAAVFKALQVAEAADPYATMQTIVNQVAALKEARADLTAALANSTGPNAATVAAYTTATTQSDLLATMAATVDSTTSTLVAAPSGANYSLASAAVDALLAQATAVLATLSAAGVNEDAADLLAVQNLVNTVTLAQTQLSGINPADGFDGLESLLARFAEIIGNGLVVTATAVDAQLDAALASLDTDVGAAQAAVIGAEAALVATLDPLGLATDNTPGNTDILKETLFIGNVAPDAGLSSPFNGWMTLFGQFFDHGLDLVGKGGFGTVYIPLSPDDPLYIPGSNTNFMPVTRATLDENGNAINKVTPFVDQNQTYTSNASHQVFLREYELDSSGRPVATGRLLDGPAAGGLATWADVKAQALNVLRIELNDFNIHSVPEILVDPYGNFIPGLNGFPQLVRSFGPPVVAVEGNLTTPVKTADGQVSTGHAFLDDIAHNANPGKFDVLPGPGVNLLNEAPDADSAISTAATPQAFGTYDNELLDAHFITGDGRGNENIGLTAVHHVFHSEHNRQVDLIQNLILDEAKAAAAAAAADPGNAALAADAANKLGFLNEWLDVGVVAGDLAAATTRTLDWNGERVFQAAKFPTEMQYQHLVFEEFARTVQPFVNVFNDFNGELDAAIVSEFAHTVYRFGHSMLTETVDRLTEDNQSIGTGGVAGAEQIGLIEAFLNPVEFTANGMSAAEAAGAIARGMTRQRGNEIDEFVTGALRNNLVGLPLDLAAINIARGRETNIATLNEAREQFYAGSSDAQVKPYGSWAEFAANLKNPASVINFIAAYGTHDSITSATTAADKRDAAMALVLGDSSIVDPLAAAAFDTDRLDFLHHRGAYADPLHPDNTSLGGLNNVDFWIGGLAEKQMAFGGMLGTTFNFVFETQLENLQNGDRFYYLSRLANLNLTAQLENNKFAEMIARNTDADHLPGNVFKAMDYQLEVDQSRQVGPDPAGLANGQDPFLSAIVGDTKVIREAPAGVDPAGDYDSYLQFIGGEHVVLGGTAGRDILIADEGDDTLWGDDGDDRLEGGIGNDFVFGGEGADIITDQFGDDEIRSQGGDDVVSAGQGFNLIITDTGNDFVWAGADIDELLLGQGDDFGAGGADDDMIIGGEGSDWIESGLDNGLYLGDNGDLIQGLPIKRSVDSPIEGHDILISTGGNADFDAETGNDIMVGGLGTDRFFGAFGFDWASYKNDPFGVEADMSNRQFAPPAIASSPGVILDRYAQTEGLSGSSKTDFLRGDNAADLKVGIPGTVTSLGLASQGLDDALKDDSLDLIQGLRAFLAPSSTPGTDAGEAGVNTFSTGNILLGGQGSDVLEGRGGNDILDGDRALDVVIRVTADASRGQTFAPFEVQGMADIQERMFTGEIKVSQLEMVRRIVGSDDDGTAVDVDVAQFSGRRADYIVEGLDHLVSGEPLVDSSGFAADVNGDGFVSVRNVQRDVAGNIINLGPELGEDNVGGLDGTDRLKNVERLFFSDQTIKANNHSNSIATGAVNVVENTLTGELTASLTGALTGDIADVDGFNPANVTLIWQSELQPGSGIWTNVNRVAADEFSPVTGPTFTPTGAEAGLNIRVLARFVDNAGAVEHVASVPLLTTNAGGRPVFDEANAILGPNIAGTIVDGAALPNPSFGILEDSGSITFTLGELWLNRFNGQPLATDPNGDTVTVLDPNVLTVRERDGAGTVGTVIEVNPAAPWTLPDGSPNLAKQFTFTPAANFEGTVVFEFDITDGNTESVPAEVTLDVFGVNDAPVAGTNTGNVAAVAVGTTFTFTEADLIGNATDVDGDQIRLFRDPAADPLADPSERFVTLADPTQGTIVLNADGSFTFTAAATTSGPVVLEYSITDGIATVATAATFTMGGTFNGNGAENAIIGTAAADIINGNGGADILDGGAGNDSINGGGGGDTITGGEGDDTITMSATQGRDVVDGGLGGTDTLVVNGNNAAEVFRVFTRAEAELAGLSGLAADTDIVITRNTDGVGGVVDNANIIAELDEIEEIVINTGDGADTVVAIGNFDPTNLSFNTITINDQGGDDTVDLTELDSDHHVVFNAGDGTDVAIGFRSGIDELYDGLDEDDEDSDDEDIDGGTDDPIGGYPIGGGPGQVPATPNVIMGPEMTLVGTSGDDVIIGTNANTVIYAGDGRDAVTGGGEGVVVVGGSGNDVIDVGDGDAVVLGGDDIDTIETGSGDDHVWGGIDGDIILTGDGKDMVWGEEGDDLIGSGAGDDLVFGDAGDDEIDAGEGNDRIWGGDGADLINAGGGDDRIEAGAGSDAIFGGFGNDTVVFRTAAEVNGDSIGDFAPGDRIDLHFIDADSTIGGNNSFSLLSATAFTTSGQLIVHYNAESNQTLLEGNTDANLDTAEFQLVINGDHVSDLRDPGAVVL